MGPYKVDTKQKVIIYKGNKLFPKTTKIVGICAPDLSRRHLDLKEQKRFAALIRIYGVIHKYVSEFMEAEGVVLFDLPITTRMISSPGALTGTIISDVDPFKIKFFDNDVFLTQSSQLYLEFAITCPGINQVYCWDKSFRRERADFRHLPEFTHIEYEGNIDFEQNLELQERFLKYIVHSLLRYNKEELGTFITEEDMAQLQKLTQLKRFKRITFHDAFKILYEYTKDEKYKTPTINNFGAYEEILLTELMGNEPVFVTNYIGDEVAFYHANMKENPSLVMNADLLFPGYGELIGSGQRVNTREETLAKAKHFKLNIDDYQAYIDSRDPINPKIHSGWGMGIERFLQCILKLPYIWEAKVFPRVDNSNRP